MEHARRFADWGRSQALPFWAERGWDRRNGGFFETLDMDGAGITGDIRRVRAQARQAYVFARAACEGWLDRTDLAEAGLDRLARIARSPDGRPGWVHLVHDDGRVADSRRDFYDHAFIILAAAWVWKATGAVRFLDMAHETLAFLDTHMPADHGGYREAIGAPLLPRRQNPHMHLFEALLSLYELTGETALVPRIDAIKGLFDRHFFVAETGLLREFFEPDWQPHGERGAHVEPGHWCEWTWLLAEHGRLLGHAADPAGPVLYRRAMQQGRSAQTGLLMAGMTAQGDIVDARSRTWMQTEWVRAAAVAGSRSELDQACRALVRWHLEGVVSGGWIDKRGADGEDLASGMPASTLYHLVGALAEVERHL